MGAVGSELSWPPPSFSAVLAPQFSSGIKYLLKAYDNDKDKDTHKDILVSLGISVFLRLRPDRDCDHTTREVTKKV